MLNILLRKMFSITFCFAEHFPLENVQQNKMYASNAFVTFCWCKNAFDAKMLCFLLCKKQRCCAKMHLMQKCIWCKNAFDAKMHFCNATRTFYEVKCSASHFPKENVQHHIFQRKMFSITFSFGKCSALVKCKSCIKKKIKSFLFFFIIEVTIHSFKL